MNIQHLLLCPTCGCSLSNALQCRLCKTTYTFRHGVYHILSEALSADQNSLWKITEEMLENPDAFLKQEAQEEYWIKDYIARKNPETLAAENKLNDYVHSLLGSVSGMVCDLATGMGGMLQKLLDFSHADAIVCTDIDPHILAWTRILKKTDDSRVHYVATDGRHLSLRKDSFDYITSIAAFGNIPDSDMVAKEVYRILKSGGKLLVQGQYIEKDSKSYEIAKQYHLESGLVEETLIDCLHKAGFHNVVSTVVASAIWAENPYDLIPAAGDMQRFCVMQAIK